MSKEIYVKEKFTRNSPRHLLTKESTRPLRHFLGNALEHSSLLFVFYMISYRHVCNNLFFFAKVTWQNYIMRRNRIYRKFYTKLIVKIISVLYFLICSLFYFLNIILICCFKINFVWAYHIDLMFLRSHYFDLWHISGIFLVVERSNFNRLIAGNYRVMISLFICNVLTIHMYTS